MNSATINPIILTHIYPTTQNGKNYFTVTYQKDGKRNLKRAPVMFQTEAEVKEWFETIFKPGLIKEQETKKDAITITNTNNKTIAGLAEWWLDYRKNDPELHNKKGFINNWILGKGRNGGSAKALDLPNAKHPIADMDLEIKHNPFNDADITKENDDKFTLAHDWITSIPRAPATVRNIVQTMRTFIDDCRAKGKISRTNSINYFSDNIVLSAINNGKPVTKVIGDENTITLPTNYVNALLNTDTIPIERRVRYMLAFATGLRDSEISGLQWQDLNLEAKTITVDRQLKRASKGTLMQAQFKAPKKASYRTLPLHSSAVIVLNLWKNSGWLDHVGRKPNENDAVLPNQLGEFYHPHSSVFIRRDLKKANLSETFRGVGGVQAQFDFHSTRRTFATMCDAAGIDSQRISALMGHKARGVTAKHYLDRNLEACRASIETLKL